METRYFFRHMPVSEALQTFTDQKLESIANSIHDSFPVNVTIEQDAMKWTVKVSCHSLDKHLTEVHAQTDEVHKSVDQMIDKLSKVLRRRKDKKVHKRHTHLSQDLDLQEAEKQLEEAVMAEAIDAAVVVAKSR